MFRYFALLLYGVLLWSGPAILSLAPPAQAYNTYDLVATSPTPDIYSDFTVQYIDLNGNALLGPADYVFVFSGMSVYEYGTYTEITKIPQHSESSPYTDGTDLIAWVFSKPGGDTWDYEASFWTYAQTAQYITYELTAYTKQPGIISNFTVQYVDRDGDRRVGTNDYVFAFSGVTINGQEYSELTVIPEYSAEYSPYTDGPESVYAWQFETSSGDIQNFVEWDFTYGQTPVPLPSSAWMLGTGLIPLAWACRRKYRLKRGFLFAGKSRPGR
jgi:hypothetical protein